MTSDRQHHLAPVALLRQQSWLSPAFPTGSYSYSHGLEWAVEAGHIHDRESLVDWLAADLCHGSGRNEAIFFIEAWRCATKDNCGNEHQHVQAFDVRRAIGGVARKGAEGELIISGHTGQVVKTDRDYRAYAGLAPDLFAGDAVALNVFRKALWKEKRFEPQAFQSRQNFFAKANVTAIGVASILHWKTAWPRYGRSHRSFQEKIQKDVNCPGGSLGSLYGQLMEEEK